MQHTNAEGNSFVPDQLYRRLIGSYRFPSGHEIVLTRKGLGEETLYFYAEGDSLVRMFPHSAPDGGFDPAPLYAQLRCPVLCIWGEDDTVLPVAESITCIHNALQASAHSDWTLRNFPKANHLLYLNHTSVDEQTNEAMHERLQNMQFPIGLFELMITWAGQRLGLA